MWLRLYEDIVDNPKLRLLAFEDRWHFVALLCCKKSGLLDHPDAEFARDAARLKLGLDEPTFAKAIARLAKVHLIDPATLQPLGWEARQFDSDSSRARTKAWRERAKRHRDVTVTVQETETDTEKAKQEQVHVPQKRGTRLPSTWSVSDEDAEFCRSVGADPEAEGAKFRDYWVAVPGARGRKLDWRATWRNWCRNAGHVRKPESAVEEAERRLREYARSR